mmetsp:Transcript_95807/g.276080  ORF Transcript_95807/g.276080 Transcript_95807/m.276080 type:complete len:282 (-) Transcript_95807:147-992(-)
MVAGGRLVQGHLCAVRQLYIERHPSREYRREHPVDQCDVAVYRSPVDEERRLLRHEGLAGRWRQHDEPGDRRRESELLHRGPVRDHVHRNRAERCRLHRQVEGLELLGLWRQHPAQALDGQREPGKHVRRAPGGNRDPQVDPPLPRLRHDLVRAQPLRAALRCPRRRHSLHRGRPQQLHRVASMLHHMLPGVGLLHGRCLRRVCGHAPGAWRANAALLLDHPLRVCRVQGAQGEQEEESWECGRTASQRSRQADGHGVSRTTTIQPQFMWGAGCVLNPTSG